MQCNIPLTSVAAFPVDAVTRTNGLSRFRLKYSVIVVTKKLLPTPAPSLKNIWKGLGSVSLSFSATLQYTACCVTKFERCLCEHISKNY